MAQTTNELPGRFDGTLAAENLAVSLPSGVSTVLLELPTAGLARVGVEVDPTVQAFTAFLIEVKFHPSGNYVTLTNAVTATPLKEVLDASGTLATLAAGAKGWVLLDVGGFTHVRISATVTGAGALCDARANGK